MFTEVPLNRESALYEGPCSIVGVRHHYDPPDTFNLFKALWDTGASDSMVTSSVIETCRCKFIDRKETIYPSGHIVSHARYEIDFEIDTDIVIKGVSVSEAALFPDIDVIIGRDIIFGHGGFEWMRASGFRWNYAGDGYKGRLSGL